MGSSTKAYGLYDPRCSKPDPLDEARREIRGLKDPPDGKVVGYITLTYDNIGIFSGHHDAYQVRK